MIKLEYAKRCWSYLFARYFKISNSQVILVKERWLKRKRFQTLHAKNQRCKCLWTFISTCFPKTAWSSNVNCKCFQNIGPSLWLWFAVWQRQWCVKVVVIDSRKFFVWGCWMSKAEILCAEHGCCIKWLLWSWFPDDFSLLPFASPRSFKLTPYRVTHLHFVFFLMRVEPQNSVLIFQYIKATVCFPFCHPFIDLSLTATCRYFTSNWC